VRRIWGFGSYEVEEFLLTYDAVPRGNRIPTFRRNILASSPTVSKTWKTLLTKPGLSSWQDQTTPWRDVAHQNSGMHVCRDTMCLPCASEHSHGRFGLAAHRVKPTDNAYVRYTPALSVELIVLTVIATKHLKPLRHFLWH